MTSRPESPVPPFGQLTTGLYRMKRRYARWRERGAPGWLVVLTLDGRGRFGHRGGELLVSRGDLVLLRPHAPNDYGLEARLKRWNLLWAYFFPRIEWHSFLQWPEVAPGIMHLRLSDPVVYRTLVRQLAEVDRLNNGSPHRNALFAMNALEKFFLECDLVNPRSQYAKLDARVARALNYLCDNLAQSVALPDVARHCGLSLSRLAHLFREQVGQTPRQFFEEKRFERACRLLELTQNPIAVVAAEVGFGDPFHFSNRFRRRMGLSPRDYRRRLVHTQKIPWLHAPPPH